MLTEYFLLHPPVSTRCYSCTVDWFVGCSCFSRPFSSRRPTCLISRRVEAVEAGTLARGLCSTWWVKDGRAAESVTTYVQEQYTFAINYNSNIENTYIYTISTYIFIHAQLQVSSLSLGLY